MALVTVDRAAGLFTAQNELSTVPPGALVTAENVVIRSNGVVEPRRGHSTLPGTFGSGASDKANELLMPAGQYGTYGTVYVQWGTALASTQTTGGAYNAISGTYAPPDDLLLRMKGFDARLNYYITTAAGIQYNELRSILDPFYAAGLPRAMDFTGPGTSGAAGSAARAGSQVAYRHVWVYKDQNANLKIGPPSGRLVYANSTGSGQTVTTVLRIPAEIATSTMPGTWYYRLYRSANSGSAAVAPTDELFLVYEGVPTAAEITARTVSIDDNTPDTWIGDPLYTNPASGEGLVNSNYRPPIALDACWWSDRAWYANTTQTHRMSLGAVGASTSAHASAIAANDVLLISGRVYTALNSGAGANQYNIDASTDVGLQLSRTVQNLVSSVNTDVSANPSLATVLASYASGDDDVPGKFDLEATALGSSAFYIGASKPRSWSVAAPLAYNASAGAKTGTTVTLTIGSHTLLVGDSVMVAVNSAETGYTAGLKTITAKAATTISYSETAGGAASLVTPAAYWAYKASKPSDNDAVPGRVYFSRIGEPEAVPLLNFLEVGQRKLPVWRIVPLKDKLFVFKPEGIYVVSGEYPFRTDLLDNTARIVCPDSAQVLGNQIYCLTNQGVVSVGDSGVGIVSRPIETELLGRVSQLTASVKRYAFAMANESERQYVLYLPTGAASYCDEAYVYNYLTQAWTTWTGRRRCGRVMPYYDVMWLGAGGAVGSVYNTVYKENRTFTTADYHDDEVSGYSITARGTAVAGVQDITLSSASGIVVGDYFYSTVDGHGLVTAVNGNVLTLVLGTTSTTFNVTHTTGTRWARYVSTVKWAGQFAGSPAETKQFRDVTMHFRRHDVWAPTTSVASDFVGTPATSVLTFATRSVGITTDVTDYLVPANKRVLVPANHQLAAYLSVGYVCTQAAGYWALNGYTLAMDGNSERNSR